MKSHLLSSKISAILVMLFFLLCSCQSEKKKIEINEKKKIFLSIKKLETDKEKNEFLYKLWHEDQNYRSGEEGLIIANHGYRSKEHLDFMKNWKSSDNIAFYKLKNYLEVHGYPENREKYHELSINAFPIIIGHNHNYKSQKAVLKYLYDAYKEGHCNIDDVVWVLGEMHESKFNGKRYEMKSNRFTTEQEFKELNAALNLNLQL